MSFFIPKDDPRRDDASFADVKRTNHGSVNQNASAPRSQVGSKGSAPTPARSADGNRPAERKVAWLDPPLVPKNGHTLQVLFMCRVSSPGVGKQDIRSLDDQENLLRSWLDDHYEGKVAVRVIAGSGSGERLDRQETAEAQEAIETGQYDLLLAEDLGRIMRRSQALNFCELAEDHATRVIAINDSVDTGTDGWRLSAFFAAMRHEMYNADTGKRIRRTLRSRFQSGGVIQTVIYGYLKPAGAKHDSQLTKDPEAEAIYDEWFRRLENGETFSEIADWLNQAQVPTGPYSRGSTWTNAMVGRITRNPMLKGVRQRNKKIAKRTNSTGRHRSVKAPPEELLQRECPHLAFIEPARFDRVNALVAKRNSKYRRKGDNGRDTRANVSKKRTRYPGQCVYCGVCGNMFVFGGHGQTDHLMCNGARDYSCWNGVSVDGPLAAKKITGAILQEIAALEDFDQTFVEMVQHEAVAANSETELKLRQLDTEAKSIARELSNVMEFVRKGETSSTLMEEIHRLELEQERLRQERDLLNNSREVVPKLPSVTQLKQVAQEAFGDLALNDYSFANLLRRFTPRIVVFPYRLFSGGRVVLRARFKLQLAALIPDAATRAPVGGLLEREIEVDLFDPPQHEKYRQEVVDSRAQGEGQSTIAARLGLTITAVQRAASQQRKMNQLGLLDPYLPVTEPPEDQKKLRRHKHPRYLFRPLPGAGEL